MEKIVIIFSIPFTVDVQLNIAIFLEFFIALQKRRKNLANKSNV